MREVDKEKDTLKRELLAPFYFEAGAALYDCQVLEYSVGLLLYYMSFLGMATLNKHDMENIMENRDKKTLGQLINLLKTKVNVSGGIEVAIDRALAARNTFIHGFLARNIERIIGNDSRKDLIREIRALRSIIRKGDEVLRPFNYGLGKMITGVDQKKLENELWELFICNQ